MCKIECVWVTHIGLRRPGRRCQHARVSLLHLVPSLGVLITVDNKNCTQCGLSYKRHNCTIWCTPGARFKSLVWGSELRLHLHSHQLVNTSGEPGNTPISAGRAGNIHPSHTLNFSFLRNQEVFIVSFIIPFLSKVQTSRKVIELGYKRILAIIQFQFKVPSSPKFLSLTQPTAKGSVKWSGKLFFWIPRISSFFSQPRFKSYAKTSNCTCVNSLKALRVILLSRLAYLTC